MLWASFALAAPLPAVQETNSAGAAALRPLPEPRHTPTPHPHAPTRDASPPMRHTSTPHHFLLAVARIVAKKAVGCTFVNGDGARTHLHDAKHA